MSLSQRLLLAPTAEEENTSDSLSELGLGAGVGNTVSPLTQLDEPTACRSGTEKVSQRASLERAPRKVVTHCYHRRQ